jgi:hypothetical protein
MRHHLSDAATRRSEDQARAPGRPAHAMAKANVFATIGLIAGLFLIWVIIVTV